MNDSTNTSAHSARAVYERCAEKAAESKKLEVAGRQAAEYAAEQVVLLREANAISKAARVSDEESSKESGKSSRRGFWANVIAIASLLVAIASLVFQIL